MTTAAISTYTQINDNQTFEKVFNPLIQAICTLAKEHKTSDPLPIVAIAGSPGVGKTHFTEMLSTALKAQGVKVAVLAGDGFTGQEPAPGALLPFHSTFDNAKCHAFMNALKEGRRQLEKPVWTVINNEKQRVTEQVDYTGVDVVLYDHAFALCDETSFNFQQYASIKILVEAEISDILEWKWERGRRSDRQGHADKGTFLKCKVVRGELFRNVIGPIIGDAHYIVLKDRDHSYKLAKVRF